MTKKTASRKSGDALAVLSSWRRVAGSRDRRLMDETLREIFSADSRRYELVMMRP